MSFLLSVCGYNFSLNMSDGRMKNLATNSIEDENFQKVHKVNNNVCIGFTGDPIGAGLMLDELRFYDLSKMTLERIKRISIEKLKTLTLNHLGVKVIFSGKNKSNHFVTYTIDSKNNFAEEKYVDIPQNGFAVVYSGTNEDILQGIVYKHIYATSPWKSLDELRQHMIDCINEVSSVDDTVNNKIFEELVV